MGYDTRATFFQEENSFQNGKYQKLTNLQSGLEAAEGGEGGGNMVAA